MTQKMSEVKSFKDNVPKFLLNNSKGVTTRLVRDTYLPIQNTSPVHRPNAKLPKTLTGKKIKHLSCPVQSAPKRMWYECPKCHRFRSFMDDRDQFILYGVTRLWPTPPPAPPPFTSQQVGDSSSVDCMEGTYNICRVFRTSSAKLHPRSSQRKLDVIIPTTGFLRKSPTRNKVRQKQHINRQVIIADGSQCSSNANNTGDDIAHMVDLLRRYASPHKSFVLQRSVSPSSNVTKTVSEKTTVTKTENTAKVLPPTHKSRGASRPSSPKTERSVVRSFQCRSVNMTSSFSTCISRSSARQSVSQSQLESWAKRLRSAVYKKKTGHFMSENDNKSQLKQKSGNSNGRRKRHLRRKSKSKKRTCSVAKSTDASRTDSFASPRPDVCETLSGKESSGSKSGKPSPRMGLWSIGGESMMNAILSSSRSESFKKRHRIHAKNRARNLSAHHSSASRDTEEEMTISTKVTTHIEAVKISEGTATTPKQRSSKRRRMKKSSGSMNITEKSRTAEAHRVSGEEKTSSVVSSGSPYSPKNSNDPVALLEDFRNRMKKCQGKGFIKASHIEVIAYLEGKKSDTKPQATPKTYQQMGLAPLRRSESSENCTQFLNFKCALSDTEIMPKLALSGHSRRKKKKKKKKSKSTPSSPNRKSDGDNPLKETEETKGATKPLEQGAYFGKQRHKHRGQHHGAKATASRALSLMSLSTN